MHHRLVMLAVILHAALTASAYAHHSHFYDECRRFAKYTAVPLCLGVSW